MPSDVVKSESYILMDRFDRKAKCWNNAAHDLGIGFIQGFNCARVFWPIMMIKYAICLGPAKALCFRYLNDRKSLLKTFLFLNIDLFLIVIAKVLGTRIFWICHNVDKETFVFHPRLNLVRRNIIKKNSDIVFVTDELLIPLAQEALKIDISKIKVICFGVDLPTSAPAADIEDTRKEILSWCAVRRQNSGSKIGLWVGKVSPKKNRGIEAIGRLLNENCEILSFCVIGVPQAKLNDLIPNWVELISCGKLFVLFDIFSVSPEYWSEIADFVWRPMDDLSIPLTAYHSAYAEIPLICEEKTFLSSFVSANRIGFGVNFDHIDSVKLVSGICNFSDRQCYSKFISSNSWERGALSLFNA